MTNYWLAKLKFNIKLKIPSSRKVRCLFLYVALLYEISFRIQMDCSIHVAKDPQLVFIYLFSSEQLIVSPLFLNFAS